MEDEIDDELLQCLEEKIASGHSMIERLKLMDKIDGIDKLIRKIQQEIKFLEKVKDILIKFIIFTYRYRGEYECFLEIKGTAITSEHPYYLVMLNKDEMIIKF